MWERNSGKRVPERQCMNIQPRAFRRQGAEKAELQKPRNKVSSLEEMQYIYNSLLAPFTYTVFRRPFALNLLASFP